MGISALISGLIAGVSEIGSAVAGVGSAVAGGLTAAGEAIGIPASIAGTIGTVATDALGQGVLGAGEAALQGKNPLTGLEEGAIGGAVGGIATPGLEALGVPTGIAPEISGALGGAAGAAATGQNVGTGALLGGVNAGVGTLVGGAGGGGVAGGGGIAPQGGTSTIQLSGPNAVPGTQSPLSGDVMGAPGVAGVAGAGGNIGPVGVSDTSGSPASGTLTAPPASTIGSGAGANALGGTGTVSPVTVSPPSESPGALVQPTEIAAQPSTITPISAPTNPTLSAPIAPFTAGTSATGGLSGLFGNPKADVALAGLGLDLLHGDQQTSEQKALEAQAAQAGGNAQRLESYETSGTLPPGMQSLLDAAAAGSRATVNSEYAARGMSGSSARAQDIAAVGQHEAQQSAQLATQLFQQGVQESQLSAELYQNLLQVQLQQDKDFSTALGGLVSAVANFNQPVVPQQQAA